MPSRRRTLSVLGTLTVAGLAGCAGTLDGGGPGENDDENSTAEDSSDDSESNDETAPDEGDATDEGDDGDRGEEPENESGNGNENENEIEIENESENDTTADETFLTVSSGDQEIDAVRYEQVESASEPATIDGQHVLPVVLTDGGADSFRGALEEVGAMESPRDSEVTAYQGGEAVHSRQLSEELIATAEASGFAGPFNVPLESREQADEIYEAIDSDEE